MVKMADHEPDVLFVTGVPLMKRVYLAHAISRGKWAGGCLPGAIWFPGRLALFRVD